MAEDASSDTPSSFDASAFLRTLTTHPGVYRMLDSKGTVLYVGKARNLKRRVASYFRANPASAKVRSLVSHTRAMEVTVTHTEGEALILESTLIKRYLPRYNVLLRDDKGYPYIHLSAGPYPRLHFHRGPRRGAGRYFGPYPSTGAVRNTLELLQRVFKLRQCEDSFFSNRSRPCLQFQIKRCSGPCTAEISDADYQRDVQHTVQFLEGKSDELVHDLVRRMETAAADLHFEEAAVLRDQIAQLRKIQEHQYVSGERGNLDVVALAMRGGQACVQVFFFREGRLLGNKVFYPRLPGDEDGPDSVLMAFLSQYYLDRDPPAEILINHSLSEAALITQVLSERSGHSVKLSLNPRGERARWLGMAVNNAEHALDAQLSSQAGMQRRLQALAEALDLDVPPARLECFDISHTLGESPVASCVVFDGEGPRKSDYRRYNIENITPGDDYAAMAQALRRRYSRLKREEARLPEVAFIDGGKGQLQAAAEVLQELEIYAITLVGVAKGSDRRVGLEELHLLDEPYPRMLPGDSPALHLIQQIRDEAHRHAITGHRQRRGRSRKTSVLESIPGVGPKRRRQLLLQFGGLQQLSRAGVEDIARVESINRELAQRIYDAFHSEN